MSLRSKFGRLVAGATLGGLVWGCQSSAPEPSHRTPTVTVKADLLTIQDSNRQAFESLVGVVRPEFQSTLSTKVMGRVVSVQAREGDSVRAGQTLIQIDGGELASGLQVAEANQQAATVGVQTAVVSAEIEDRMSRARIAEAKAQVGQARATLVGALARLDQAKTGLRKQEIAVSHVAVVQAESSLKLAQTELERVRSLVQQGALAGKLLDIAQNQYDLAKGRLDAAVAAESMAIEGSRSEEIRAAEGAVAAARSALMQAESGVRQAQAAAMQTEVRRQAIDVARAQRAQSAAAVESARVSLSYSNVVAPFTGKVTARLVDPGAMAGPGSPLLTVEGGELRFVAVIPESLVARLRTGQRLPIRVDALPNLNLRGSLVEVLPQADASSHTFQAKFSLGKPPQLRSGMFGRLELPTDRAKGIWIPKGTTWVREGLHYVYSVNPDGVVRLRLVTLGEARGDRVEVLSGLAVGDRIISGDRSQIHDGIKVESR